VSWLADRADAGEVHIVPLADLIEHEETPDCVCGPNVEHVPNPDGPDGWMYVHSSLDGREKNEPTT
jgi:hypothetical protein